MFRLVTRSILRGNFASTTPLQVTRQSRTLFATAAPKKSSFKSTVLRWGVAGGVVYYYCTTSVFADEPKSYEKRPPPSTTDNERPPSLLYDVGKSSQRELAKPGDAEDGRMQTADETQEEGLPEKNRRSQSSEDDKEPPEDSLGEEGSEELAEETGQEGAFNPETGEINWDCPCLGGMAHGPCGEEFRAAFSCFVFSAAEPKGADCIDKFKDMQTCFQQHPEVYGEDNEEQEPESSDAETALDISDKAATLDTKTVDIQKPEEISAESKTPVVKKGE